MADQVDLRIKGCMIGNSDVGKTSILYRLMTNDFKIQEATIGIDFSVIQRTIRGRNIKLTLWDTAGQERFGAICKNVCRNVAAIIIVFDITDLKSYVDIVKWLNFVKDEAHEDAKILVLANKMDRLCDAVIDIDDVEREMNDKGFQFNVVSAKTGAGIKEAFDYYIHSFYQAVKDKNFSYHLKTVERHRSMSEESNNVNNNLLLHDINTEKHSFVQVPSSINALNIHPHEYAYYLDKHPMRGIDVTESCIFGKVKRTRDCCAN
jgi:small GTP-binding protein